LAQHTQAARNFLMDLGHRTASVKFLIRDRAGQFTGIFDAVFTAEGIRILASPAQAPKAVRLPRSMTSIREGKRGGVAGPHGNWQEVGCFCGSDQRHGPS
jgi:hypothetical protein